MNWVNLRYEVDITDLTVKLFLSHPAHHFLKKLTDRNTNSCLDVFYSGSVFYSYAWQLWVTKINWKSQQFLYFRPTFQNNWNWHKNSRIVFYFYFFLKWNRLQFFPSKIFIYFNEKKRNFNLKSCLFLYHALWFFLP